MEKLNLIILPFFPFPFPFSFMVLCRKPAPTCQGCAAQSFANNFSYRNYMNSMTCFSQHWLVYNATVLSEADYLWGRELLETSTWWHSSLYWKTALLCVPKDIFNFIFLLTYWPLSWIGLNRFKVSSISLTRPILTHSFNIEFNELPSLASFSEAVLAATQKQASNQCSEASDVAEKLKKLEIWFIQVSGHLF